MGQKVELRRNHSIKFGIIKASKQITFVSWGGDKDSSSPSDRLAKHKL